MNNILAPFRLIAATRGALPILLILGTAGIIFLLMATRPELAPVEIQERVWPVDTVTATYSDIQPNMKLFGEVVAGRRTELLALVGGRIVEVGENFHEGGRVRKGDLLVQIDRFEYRNVLAEQRSLLKEAEVRLKVLNRDLERARELFNEKNVSEQFLDNAELDVLQQEAVVEQRRIAVDRARRDLNDSRLTAPFDGVLFEVNANLGKQIGEFGTDKIADLIDTGKLEVRFSMSNAQYGRLIESGEPLQGRPVDVSWRVGAQDLKFSARLQRVGAEIDSTTGGVDIFAVIESEAAETMLRPGAFVWVELPDKVFKNVLRAPESAVYGDDLVFLIGDNRLVERRIAIHGYDGSDVLFSSADERSIENGDQIVITQLREAGAGVKVEVR
ncbi:MAG: efflux RND transporter periplasmic adaptor subunit [Gammaproteobacteria bacterium]